MQALRDLARRRIKDESVPTENMELKERLFEMGETIQSQRLQIMELEENHGAITQENAWMWEEIQDLKCRICELESMIYGQEIRLAYSFR